jgi:hypothetical protein
MMYRHSFSFHQAKSDSNLIDVPRSYFTLKVLLYIYLGINAILIFKFYEKHQLLW